MQQQGQERKPSRYVGVRLNSDDQQRLEQIIAAGFAESIADAFRFALRCAARIAKRRMGRTP